MRAALRLADATLIGVASYAGCAQRSEFTGSAAYGYRAADAPASGRTTIGRGS